MAKASRTTVDSEISVKNRVVLPREVRHRLQVGPGDRLRFVIDVDGVHLERASLQEDRSVFETFTEWAGEADEEAYADL